MKRTVATLMLVVLAGCATDTGPATTAPPVTTTTTSDSSDTTMETAATEATDGQGNFPDVIGVSVASGGDGTYRFDVTISSSYDSPEQYADAWRVVGPDGTVYGVRVLTHPHANEQPFTRSLDDVEIPDDVTNVVIEGRDLVNGWGGQTMETDLPDR